MEKYFVLICLFLLIGCGSDKGTNRTRIRYWEKWTGFEGEAIASVVQRFNNQPEREKDKIEVELITVSRIDRKLLLAIAGGDPPDLAGIDSFVLYSFADKRALMELTPFLKKSQIRRSQYIPAYWNLCKHRKKLWALPTTPVTVALHWNKRLFREAGLNPNRAPTSIAELDSFAEKLTIWQRGEEIRRGPMPAGDGWSLKQIGFLPQQPGWWAWAFGYWFGGQIWDGDEKITISSPENIAAFEWIQSYTHKYGINNIEKFASGFGNFSSPQNPFLNGKVAMELQGVWMHNFIEKYSPGMDWAAAPFPMNRPTKSPVTNVEADVIVIPKGSPNPREAFKFIQYLSSQEGMEILCAGHRKFSPLKDVSNQFETMNPPINPYLRMFRKMSFSPLAFSSPPLSIWNEYRRELGVAFDEIRLLKKPVKPALNQLQERMQKRLDKEQRRRNIREQRGDY